VRNGGKVVFADLGMNSAKLEEITSSLGANASWAAVDVTNAEQVGAALDKLESKFGVVNTVVSCAGIAVATRTLSKKGPHSLEDFAKVLTVNTIGTFNVARLSAERLYSLIGLIFALSFIFLFYFEYY
jgi:3-hydroxyacyl-CoA dehydrogenase / 3-hydroxy-2-methylbutyryl-CoA dehydrogenase